MAELPLVDLFCGAGGLSLGLSAAGFTPVFASDWDGHACDTYGFNLGTHVLKADVARVTSGRILEATGLKSGDVCLVAGGPPCQGFSVQRRGKRDDPRNGLVLSFARLALDLKPQLILMENVAAFLGVRGSDERSELYELLEKAGYEARSKVLNAADYGVPQIRRRAFVVAWDRSRVPGFSLPAPTCEPSGWRTVRNAIDDLPEPPEDYSEHPEYPNHRRVHTSAINLTRISHVPEGGGRANIPADLQLRCHREDNGHRHLDVYGRMRWDKPAPTITAMFDNFTRGRFAHPSANRSITGREGARLQSYPDTFRFLGPKKDVARQIGNSVPPLLAAELGKALRQALEAQTAEVQLAL